MNSTQGNTDLEKIYQENVLFWETAWNRVTKIHKDPPKIPYIHEVARKFKKFQVKKVLDLACGSGWLSVFLSKYNFDVTGIDISPAAISLANRWKEEENIPNITFNIMAILKVYCRIVAMTVMIHLRELNGKYWRCRAAYHWG